jgi:O-antigen ligase
MLIISLLLYSIAFFATWGFTFNAIIWDKFSLIYPTILVLSIFFWLLFIKDKFVIYTKYLNWFILFTIVHITVIYGLIIPEALHSGNNGEIPFARFLLFSIGSYAIGCFLNSAAKMDTFSFFYGLGYLISFVSLFSITGTGVNLRFSGGYMNPNSFGISSMMAIFLNLIVIFSLKKTIFLRTISFLIIFVGFLGLILSGSRSAISGTFIGVAVAFMLLRNLKYRFVFSYGLIALTIIGLSIIPKEIETNTGERFERMQSSQLQESRFIIWKNYLQLYPKYVLLGVGFGRTTEVIKNTKVGRERSSPSVHNMYLSNLVQFGIIGFILFLAGGYQIVRLIYVNRKTASDSIVIGFIGSWIISCFFGEYHTSRDFWIFLAYVGAYSLINKKNLPNNLPVRNTISKNKAMDILIKSKNKEILPGI